MQRLDIFQHLKHYIATTLLDGDERDLDGTTPLLEWGILNSLAMTRLLAFIQQQFQIALAPDTLLAAHFETLDALTEVIYSSLETAPAAERISVQPPSEGQETWPVSPAQERIWFLTQLEPQSTAYNEYVALRMTGQLDLSALLWSLEQIAHRHESLRTCFACVDGLPVQRVMEPAAGKLVDAASTGLCDLVKIDLEAYPLFIREAQAVRLAEEQVSIPFTLDQAPLWRSLVYQIDEQNALLLFVFHHLIVDGWSVGLLFQELTALYTARTTGAEASLLSLPLRYRDLATWQRQQEPSADLLTYWQQELATLPPALELPTDYPRPSMQSYRGASYELSFSPALSAALRAFSSNAGVTPFMVLLTAFQILLARLSGQEEFLIGTPVANRHRAESASLIGPCMNMLALRARLTDAPSVRTVLQRVRTTVTGAYAHQELSFEQLMVALQPERNLSHSPLFQVMFNMQEQSWLTLTLPDLEVEPQALARSGAKYDLTLSLVDNAQEIYGYIEYCSDLFTRETIARWSESFRLVLEACLRDPDQPISMLPLLSPVEEQRLLYTWNATAQPISEHCLPHLIEAVVARMPEAVALIYEDSTLTYTQLDTRANALAHYLRQVGARPDEAVGLCVERSLEMVIGLLGILKAGAAYVPLDPGYPRERLALMCEDAQVKIVVTQEALASSVSAAQIVCLDTDWPRIAQQPATSLAPDIGPENLAYIVYTSGSTGTPRGVMVTHRNVVNCFTGMTRVVGSKAGTNKAGAGTWLALTTLSFDISALELLWTLTQGFTVVVLAHQHGLPRLNDPRQRTHHQPVDFSLFYFANNDEQQKGVEKYRLLLEGARFADTHGFKAVWTPERHFHPFGGLYPNPAVTGAALAVITQNLEIRAGSAVLPLHHPLRVAEEWSVVDNLSQGRVSVSFASGWQATDFVLAPDNYHDRKAIMAREIETVRKLWRGEGITLRNGVDKATTVRIFPHPVQTELPVWITSGGSRETFQIAGTLGTHVLTHLLGQTMEELAAKIQAYREARAAAGYDPATGRVALMLHTFIAPDREQALETVRAPFLTYLKSSFSLMQDLLRNLGQDLAQLSEDDADALLNHIFTRYAHTYSLIGTPETCLELVKQLKDIGVNEIACLIDFGVETEAVIQSLVYLDEVQRRSNPPQEARTELATLVEQIQRHRVTHLQCTPSLANLMAQDTEVMVALRSLHTLLLGGEALPTSLAQTFAGSLPARLLNMYGPTETTIWSTSWQVDADLGSTPIGQPLVNTQVYVLDQQMQPVPVGVPGMLYIAGQGLARGYLRQPEQTAARFVPNPFSTQPGARMYDTGDIACWRPDGTLAFIGRRDQQVKLRGARIELGEIEHVLNQHPAVKQSGVVQVLDVPGGPALVAYVTLRQQTPLDDLRSYLVQHLPPYMVPAHLVELAEFPLTASSKLNRQALPRLQNVQVVRPAFVAPRSELEEQMARIWVDLLGLSQVGIYDNFFALGGHSLLATQLLSRIASNFNSQISLRELFEAPTIAGVLEHMLAREVALADADLLQQALAELDRDAVSSA